MRKINLKQLLDAKACSDQVVLFVQKFGASVDVTVELAVSLAGVFDFHWAAENLLQPSALAEYERVEAPAWSEYERVKAPALAEYERVKGSAWAEYRRVKTSALAEYERVKAPASAEYERVKASAWAEYERVEASTFATAYLNQEEVT